MGVIVEQEYSGCSLSGLIKTQNWLRGNINYLEGRTVRVTFLEKKEDELFIVQATISWTTKYCTFWRGGESKKTGNKKYHE